MLNNLRMNLFRMKKNKLTYILAGVSVGLYLLLFGVELLISKARNGVLSGLEIETDLPLPDLTAARYNVFDSVVGMLMFLPMLTMMFTMIFFFTEISGGYAKNLIGYRGSKPACVCANLLTSLIFSFSVLLLSAFLGAVLSALCYKNPTAEHTGKYLLFLLMSLAEIMAFNMVVLALGDLTNKHILLMIFGVIFVVYAPLVEELLSLGIYFLFEKEIDFYRYTILGGISNYSMETPAKDMIISTVIALAELGLGFVLDVAALKKQELK